MAEGWIENARQRTLAAVDEIRSGRIVPAPSDPGRCKWCDFVNVCRIETASGRAADYGPQKVQVKVEPGIGYTISTTVHGTK